MKQILKLLFLLLSHQLFAQTELQTKVDSLNTASFELRKTDQKQSLQLAHRALHLSAEAYTKGLMHARFNLGMNHALLNQSDSSLYYLNSIGYYFEGDAFRCGLLKYYLALNYSFLRDFEKAENLLNKANELFVQSESFEFQAEVQNSHGVIQARRGNRDEALAYFSKAYEIKLGHELDYDNELSNIAIIYRMLGKHEQALAFARKSLATCSAQKDSLGMVRTLITIGNVYTGAKQYDSADYSYDQALALAKTKGYDKQVLSILQNKAVVADHSERLNEALALLRQVIRISTEEDHIWARAYYELARIFRKQGMPDSSIHYARRSYRLHLKYDEPDMASQASKLVSDNFKQQRQLDSALAWLEQHLRHEDSINLRNNQAQMSDMRIRIETLEQENQINQLNQEKKLEALKRKQLVAASLMCIVVGILIIVFLIYRDRNRMKINQLKQDKLHAEVQQAQGELYQQTLHMIHLNNCMDQIEAKVKHAKKTGEAGNLELSQVLASIQLNKSLDKDWENFNKYFGKVHSGFLEQLPVEEMALTNHEQRVCALLKLGLSNREIATILNIQSKSVVMLRYRIKKKLQLEKEEDLEGYLKQL